MIVYVLQEEVTNELGVTTSQIVSVYDTQEKAEKKLNKESEKYIDAIPEEEADNWDFDSPFNDAHFFFASSLRTKARYSLSITPHLVK